MLLMLGAFITDALRIYAVFGAFLTGAAMPKGLFAEELRRRMHPLTSSFLLPLFFVYSGLNTRIGLVSTPALADLGGLVLLAAVPRQGSWRAGPPRASRRSPATPRDRHADERPRPDGADHPEHRPRARIIRPTLFTIMVLMAVVTTLMATPIFERVYGRRAERPR